MTADPVTASPDTAAEEAAYMMIAGGFHHLPVVEDERLLGVIGLRAVIGFRKPGLPGL
jgi:CBS domain-containing protein